MNARTVFITGTDTGVGKTFVACALLQLVRQQGVNACGYKPVASGCERTPEGLRNDDALALQRAADTMQVYERINSYAFEPAIAPHLAAASAGVRIEPSRLNEAHAKLAAQHDLVVVEGAGGWQVPLNEEISFADWVAAQQWPVVLVVGMRLGCINHALLSAEAISRRCTLMGWVANALPPQMPMLAENLQTLRERMPAPLLTISELAQRSVHAPMDPFPILP